MTGTRLDLTERQYPVAQYLAAQYPAAQATQSAVRSRSIRSGARRVAIMIWTASWTSLVSW